LKKEKKKLGKNNKMRILNLRIYPLVSISLEKEKEKKGLNVCLKTVHCFDNIDSPLHLYIAYKTGVPLELTRLVKFLLFLTLH
jgi:hypothetical protein